MKKNSKLIKLIITVCVLAIVAAGVFFVVRSFSEGDRVSASKEDIMAVVNSMLTELIIIGVALVAIIAVLLATLPIKKKKKRYIIRSQTMVLSILIILVVANFIIFGPAFTLLNMTMSAGNTEGLSEETLAESIEVAKQVSAEGMVLLKNEDNVLPLSSDMTKLNVFGWGSTNPVYYGTGAGSFSGADVITLLQGLENAGYELNTEINDFYTRYREDRPEIGIFFQDWTVPEPTMRDYDRKKIFENAKEFSDTAVIVISRSGGEGADLPRSITDEDTFADAGANGEALRYTSNSDDVDPSKSYLELSNREIAMVERVNAEFENIIVVINSGNTMELGWIDEYENIKGVVWCPGAGDFGFDSLGYLLNGEVNPSGKTVDTYVYDLMNTPTSNNFGHFEYDNVSEMVNEVGTDDDYIATFVNYVEGIYVGYKFYETAAFEGFIDYDELVQFPFGYGLSYTSFEQTIDSLDQKDGSVKVKVTVKNIGSIAGKDVVQLYYTPPYTNGGIEKASVNLIQFAKTDLLEPGASQTVELVFDIEDMASYDYLGYGSYVVEKGEYEISLRKDSHTVTETRNITIDEDIIYNDQNEGARSSDAETAINQFDYAHGDLTYLSRTDHFKNYDEVTKAPTDFSMSDEVKARFVPNAVYNPINYVNPSDVMPTIGAENGLTITDMIGVDYDDEKWELLLDQLTVKEMSELVAVGGYVTAALDSIDMPATIETDGPIGLHSMFSDLAGTGFPSPVMIASTWNKELARYRGELVGRQAQELGIAGWYGPGLNIHRSAFSGRNWEYYSEDSVLSGEIGAQEVAGAREYDLQTFIKHFALNDQETNRIKMILTWSNEQAIREIYIKSFEMAFKEGGSKSTMTSFNFIGNQWAGADNVLLNVVLRGEWGIDCTTLTDWFGGYGYMNGDLAIRNGGDRMLTNTDRAKLLDTESATAVLAMRTASHNILYSLADANVVTGGNFETPKWIKMIVTADIILGAILLVIEVLVLLNIKKLKKNGQ